MVTNKLTVVGLNSPEKAFAESLTLYAKSSLKLTFLTPITHMYVDVLGVGGGGREKPTILDIIFWNNIYHNKHRIRGASQAAERLRT